MGYFKMNVKEKHNAEQLAIIRLSIVNQQDMLECSIHPQQKRKVLSFQGLKQRDQELQIIAIINVAATSARLRKMIVSELDVHNMAYIYV